MTKRIFVDLESTGDGSSLYNSFVELSARYYEDEELKSSFHRYYGHSKKTVYTGGVNYKKAVENSQKGFTSADESIDEFVNWLDECLKNKRAFFVSYNCNWDFRLISNWFKRNKVIQKYFYGNCICIMALCACKYDRFVTLENCSNNLGISVDKDKLHSAEYDVDLAIEVHENLLTQLKAA